jgi:hypothetical protein
MKLYSETSSMLPKTVHEPGRMQSFVASLLRHEGALVDAIEPEGLEILAPPSVRDALGIEEFSRLGFGSTLPSAARRVGIEGDWISRFSTLLGERGQWSRRVLSTSARSPGDPERLLSQELVLNNATFRLLGVTPAWTRYLVLDFRASVVSDDKRDFLLRFGVNLATGAMPDAMLATATRVLDGTETNGSLPEEAMLPRMWDRSRLLSLIGTALLPRVETVLDPFMTGLHRRLGRDQARLHLYHNDLHREATRRALALPEADLKRRREEQRAEAIGREYQARLDDLARQYATRVTVEWVQTCELIMPVYRFAVQIRRRKADRTIELDWNSVARRLEPPICEFTSSLERPSLVCDDALHLVVPAGLQPCKGCGRPFCRACHPDCCPKCATRETPRPTLHQSRRLLRADAPNSKPLA